MNPEDRTTCPGAPIRLGATAALVAAMALLVALAGGGAAQPPGKSAEKDRAKGRPPENVRGAGEKAAPAEGKAGPEGKAPARRVVEMRFVDGGALKVTLKDERLEVRTPYGTLLIPAADVERVEFGRRLPPGLGKKIEAAVVNLGSREYKARQAAQAELAALGGRAYPALVRAAESGDKEVARRAKELLTRLREAVPEEELERPEHDVVHTRIMRVEGRVAGDVLKVTTLPFGEQSVRLADVRSLGGAVDAGPGPKDVLPDPVNLTQFQNQVGKTFHFRVTGGAPGAAAGPGRLAVLGGPGPGGAVAVFVGGAVYGTDVYTTDSTLAMAAVHAGVLKAGEMGVVRVTVLGPGGAFTGTTRNGVTSNAFGFYPGSYKVSKTRR